MSQTGPPTRSDQTIVDHTDAYTCPIDDCTWQHIAPPLTIPEDATPDDTGSLAAAGRERTASIQAAMVEHFGTHPVVEWANQVSNLRQALFAGPPPLMCFGCYVDRHNAARAGQQLPPQRHVQLIVNGAGLCPDHVKLQDGPAIPGRTPGGLILGGGQLPPLGA